jgi:MscS family membrane protein
MWIDAPLLEKIIFLVSFAVGIVLLAWLERKLFNYLEVYLAKNKVIWDDVLLSAMHLPIQLSIWFVGLFYWISQTGRYFFSFNLAGNINQGFYHATVICFIIWCLFRFINRYEIRLIAFSKKRKYRYIDGTTVNALSHLARLGLYIFGIITLMEAFSMPLSGVLTFSGVAGIGFGFAAKDLLANFFGGLMIFWDRPFRVGDWINSPEKDIEGTVEYIGWRLTCIRTFASRMRYIPNAIITSIVLENASRMTHRLISTTVGVRYKDAAVLPSVIDTIQNYLSDHPLVDQEAAMLVRFSHFGPSSLDIMLYFSTKVTGYSAFTGLRQELFLKVLAIIDDHGASCAFPSSSVYLEKLPENTFPVGKKTKSKAK